jgi:hypothetical protein
MGNFWKDQAAWPDDTAEFVFFGRAVEQLGREFIGDHWIGDEFARQRLASVNYSDTRAANNFIALHLPKFGRREFDGSMAPPPTSPIYQPHVNNVDHRPTFEITAVEWAAIREFIERHNAATSTAKERAADLMKRVARLASEGKIQTIYRARVGGAFHPIPREWWNTEQLDARFASCVINPERPFEKGGTAYIFVSRTDLEHIVRPASNEVLIPYRDTGSRGPARPGRKKDSGSWALADRLLFPEMMQLINDGKAASAQQAAGILKDKIQGTGADHNRVERVARRYREENRSK